MQFTNVMDISGVGISKVMFIQWVSKFVTWNPYSGIRFEWVMGLLIVFSDYAIY